MSRCLLAFLNDLPTSEKQKLDLIFRLSFLEGVARKNAGEWARSPLRGAVEARSFFETQKIPMDPRWFGALPGAPWVFELDRRTYGMYQKWRKALDAIGLDQEDITMELIKSTTDPTGRRQDKVFYSFGLSRKDPQELANMPPDAKEVIGKGLTRALAQFIKDVMTRKSNRPQLMGPTTQQIGPSESLSREVRLDTLTSRPFDDDGKSEVTQLIDLMGDQLGAGNAILRLAESAIDRTTTDEVARFALKRFISLMTDPAYNVYTPDGKRDKRPNRSKMWSMLSKIREQVRTDMLEQFDPDGTKSEEDKTRFGRRLYNILGSSGRGSQGNVGLPAGIEKVLEEIRKTPAVEQLIKRFREERERLEMRSMTASVVRAYRIKKARASLGLLGTLLEVPLDQWA